MIIRVRPSPTRDPEQLAQFRQLGSYLPSVPPVFLDGKEVGRLAPTDIHARAWFVGFIQGRAARGLSAIPTSEEFANVRYENGMWVQFKS